MIKALPKINTKLSLLLGFYTLGLVSNPCYIYQRSIRSCNLQLSKSFWLFYRDLINSYQFSHTSIIFTKEAKGSCNLQSSESLCIIFIPAKLQQILVSLVKQSVISCNLINNSSMSNSSLVLYLPRKQKDLVISNRVTTSTLFFYWNLITYQPV